MSAVFQTRAEQRLAWLESLERPLTDEESDILRRSLHAVYCQNKRRFLAAHEREEAALLAKVEAEARRPERYRNEMVG